MYDAEFNKPLQVSSIKDLPNLLNYKYYIDLNNKLDREVGDFLRAEAPNPKFYSNDLRHQYVSALYARNLGEDTARRLGDLNELTNLSGSGTEDTKIDQINNEIGRQYGLKYPTMPRGELLYKLLSDHHANREYAKQQLK
jgi:hypothetical protein